MLSIHRLICLPLLGLLFTTSCTLRETRQEAAATHEPRFRVREVKAASLGTLDVLPLRQPADVDLPRRNQLIAGYVNHELPLKMNLLLNAYNPNLEDAAITGFDYTVLVDSKVLGSGRQALAIDLPARDSVTLPFEFEMNTYKLLGEDALPALRNFALGFGDPHRTRFALRIHPLLRSPRGRLSTLRSRRPATATVEAHAKRAAVMRD
jgi:hypothetical protein